MPEFPKAGVLQSGASLTRISRCLFHFIENQILPLTILVSYSDLNLRFQWGFIQPLLKNLFRLLELPQHQAILWELFYPVPSFTCLLNHSAGFSRVKLLTELTLGPTLCIKRFKWYKYFIKKIKGRYTNYRKGSIMLWRYKQGKKITHKNPLTFT